MSLVARLLAVVVSGLTMVMVSACSKSFSAPISYTQPLPTSAIMNPPPGTISPATPADVDVTVRKILTAYLDALNAEDYRRAASYWSPASSVTPPSGETLKIPGVSGWHFLSSEMIESTPSSAFVQVNFEVKVTEKALVGLTDGRNVRFVRLAILNGDWKITSMATRP